MFSRSYLTVTTGFGLRAVALAALVVLLVRTLGPSNFGGYAAAASLASFFSMFEFADQFSHYSLPNSTNTRLWLRPLASGHPATLKTFADKLTAPSDDQDQADQRPRGTNE